MKKFLLLALLLALPLSGSALTVTNQTNHPFRIIVNRDDQWFPHSIYIDPSDSDRVFHKDAAEDVYALYTISYQDSDLNDQLWRVYAKVNIEFTFKDIDGTTVLQINGQSVV